MGKHMHIPLRMSSIYITAQFLLLYEYKRTNALAGNWTQGSCVAGKNSTTEPPMFETLEKCVENCALPCIVHVHWVYSAELTPAHAS